MKRVWKTLPFFINSHKVSLERASWHRWSWLNSVCQVCSCRARLKMACILRWVRRCQGKPQHFFLINKRLMDRLVSNSNELHTKMLRNISPMLQVLGHMDFNSICELFSCNFSTGWWAGTGTSLLEYWPVVFRLKGNTVASESRAAKQFEISVYFIGWGQELSSKDNVQTGLSSGTPDNHLMNGKV